MRAIVVLNFLFAVQTVLDDAYLWGGGARNKLDGMNDAAYMYRGTYALIVTALLSAAFVLTTIHPGSTISADSCIRTFVYP